MTTLPPRPLHLVVMGQGIASTDDVLATAIKRCEDVLLLPPEGADDDTIAELLAVSRLAPRIGAVVPRISGDGPDGIAHPSLGRRLPRFSYIPWVEPVMLWIDGTLLAEIGSVFANGITRQACLEFLLRINRCGYRMVVANHAFLQYDDRAEIITPAMFAEAQPLLERYLASPEHRAIQLLAELKRPNGRLSILFDLDHLTDRYNGTFEAAVQLVRAAASTWPHDIDVLASAHADAWRFHGLEGLDRLLRVEPGDRVTASMVIRIGQPYTLADLERAYTRSPVVVAFLLDIISDDCGYLSLGFDANIWRFVTQESDLVIANSAYTMDCIDARFPLSSHVASLVSLHSLDVDEYRREGAPPLRGTHILVVGNSLAHKFVGETMAALTSANLPHPLSVIGVGKESALPSHIPALESGKASKLQIENLYAEAAVVVFPSHYEGFGFPILHALAWQRPVFARDTPLNRELVEKLSHPSNVYLYRTTTELVAWLGELPPWRTGSTIPPHERHDWACSSMEILNAAMKAIEHASAERIVRRLRKLDSARIPLEDQLEWLPLEQRLALRMAPFMRRLLTNRFTGSLMRQLRRFTRQR